MQCPTCSTRCSDLRDVCPNCFLDLREPKKVKGLPVTFPGLDFDALIKKYGLESAYSNYQIKQRDPIQSSENIQTGPQFLNPVLASDFELSSITAELQEVNQENVSEERREAQALFKEILQELKNFPVSDEIDLSGTLSFSPKDRETVRALFQIVGDELKGERKEQRPELLSSTERKIESEILVQRLEEVEQSVSSASSAPKKLSDLVEQQKSLGIQPDENFQQLVGPSKITLHAGIVRRTCACVIDWAFTFVLAWIGLLLYDHIEEKGYFIALASQSYDLIDWQSFGIQGAIAFLIALPCYGVFSYLSSKSTLGESWCGLVVRSNQKFKKITPFKLLTRGLLLPLYLLILPGFTRLFTKKTLIDWLSGTQILRNLDNGSALNSQDLP